VPVYTRPVTPEGRRLMKKYGFAPVAAGVVGIQLGRTYVLDDRESTD